MNIMQQPEILHIIDASLQLEINQKCLFLQYYLIFIINVLLVHY